MALAFTDGKVALVNMTTTDIIRRYREHADEVHPAELPPLLEHAPPILSRSHALPR